MGILGSLCNVTFFLLTTLISVFSSRVKKVLMTDDTLVHLLHIACGNILFAAGRILFENREEP